MSHMKKEKDKLILRVRRLRGQLDGIERALEAEAPCGEILRQIASVRGAMNGLTNKLMEEHLVEHVLLADSDESRKQGADDLLEVMRIYMK